MLRILYPDPLERWSEGNMENLIEFGAIEVIPNFEVAESEKHYSSFHDG